MDDKVREDVRVRRMAERGDYDRSTIDAILDEAYVGHVGFVDEGRPVVIPMVVWRFNDHLHIHSANKGRLASVCAGTAVCVSVTHVDGLVLARSAYNHSMNYRSLVVHGVCEVVDNPAERTAALQALVDHFAPGRWGALRPMKAKELAATVVLRVPLEHAAAKIRRGMPGDAVEDAGFPVWTGIVPINTAVGQPLPDPTMPPGDLPGSPVRR